MRILLLILTLYGTIAAMKQSPHGPNLKHDCSACHTASEWTIDLKAIPFDHNGTGFVLEGQHRQLECKMCHSALVFEGTKTRCVDCHSDVHQQTLGFDCAQCHNSSTWIIENTMDIHRQSRFPLLGIHALTDCNSCHPSASYLKFESLGVDCFDCHKESFLATTQPNHIEEGYSTNCLDCHSAKSYEWTASGFNHDFFPLTEGHRGPGCADCHGENKYGSISAECVDCHLTDFNQAENPVHDPNAFSSQCTECHTTSPGWKPADYRIHDSNSFPIYSGKHQGEWNKCTDCHANTDNYSIFSCIDCHEHSKAKMDNEHDDERDYQYESNACLECHPQGREDDD
ncbi:MAG: cytochrome c3 family protein [Prolixibacteraceae bacterium]|nr:cytochrome c3 family protein [Prolixibacteraceae bacterium]